MLRIQPRSTGLRRVCQPIFDAEFCDYANEYHIQESRSNRTRKIHTPPAISSQALRDDCMGVQGADTDNSSDVHCPDVVGRARACDLRFPRSQQALYLKPLRREALYGIPSCDLQLRSFNIQPLEFYTDFALRAAYYLGLPAYGPIPLPRFKERWTVPRSHFIFKKAQENFERVTFRRLIQIKDGNSSSVQLWLAYLRKHQYYGVGLKANIWEFTNAGVDSKNLIHNSHHGQLRDLSWRSLGQVSSVGIIGSVQKLLSERRRDNVNGLRYDPNK